MATTTATLKRDSLPLLLLASAALTGGLFAGFKTLPQLIPCADPTAQSLTLALCITLVLQLLVYARWLGGRFRWVVGAQTALVLLGIWMGFYPISPLFSSGRIPVLQGFTVITRARGTVNVAPGAIVTLAGGRPAAFQPLTLIDNDNLRCYWTSASGGALDDPQSCATVYFPPQREYDILEVSLQPGCGLPHSEGQIKISILP